MLQASRKISSTSVVSDAAGKLIVFETPSSTNLHPTLSTAKCSLKCMSVAVLNKDVELAAFFGHDGSPDMPTSTKNVPSLFLRMNLASISALMGLGGLFPFIAKYGSMLGFTPKMMELRPEGGSAVVIAFLMPNRATSF